ncbi:omptin family outer membrane protease [Aquimarina brevivitae]|uniref:omptin family outer membrane protease n=1 Tax=Aquimarina brevivitae TaxID=323412 RepID=UPI001028DF87
MFYSKYEGNNREYKRKGDGFTIGLTGKYYVNPTHKLSFFTEIATSFYKFYGKKLYFNDNILSSNYKENSEDIVFSLRPGINLFLSKKFAISSTIGNIAYSTSKSKTENLNNNEILTSKKNGLRVSLSLDRFFFGILYRI